jgi:hypothetical protein
MKRIPISAAKKIADAYNYDQVYVIGRKVGEGEHVTTYGKDKANCETAARVGDFLKYKVMGWPEYKPPTPTVGGLRIVCAANLYKHEGQTIVVPSARHFDANMHVLLGIIFGKEGYGRPIAQGFMDQNGGFHTRKDAWEIAEKNGQIARRCGGDGPQGAGLFSENLY